MSRKHVPVEDRTICAYCHEVWPCLMAVSVDAVMQMVIDVINGRDKDERVKCAIAKIRHHHPVERQ